ncbi:MAG: hypothetical protein JNN27_22455 [Planctomycetes bacterium]|nr:hypothetical protein [Planctomycetota bacterium]
MTKLDESSPQRLPRPLDEQAWEASLSAALGARVEVRYGRATREVIQLRREPQRIVVRLSGLMASAPPEIESALAEWIRGRGRRGAAQRELDRWIDARLRESARVSPTKLALEPEGEHHDLGELREHLRAREFASDFGAAALPPIGWGRAGRSRSRRSLRLGSFDPFSYSVRVHPVLDSADAPRFFVRYIVFHELLHAALDQPPDENGRRRVHGPAFRARERQYVDYERALAWEKEHIHALIASARAGRGLRLAQARPAARPPKDERGWLQRLLF